MAKEAYANNAATTLNGGIDSVVTTLVLTSGTAFPASGQFRILIGTEIIIVGARSGANCTGCTRGAENTTAASHSNGDAVTQLLTVGGLLNSPGPMSASGDMIYLNSSGTPTALAAPADGDYIIRWTSGVPSWVLASALSSVSTGSILPYGGITAPSGYLLCDGTAVSRSTYATLFTLIGTTWGAGNGTTTFNVPDLRGRAPVGSGTGSGLTNRVLGSNFGEENHLLVTSEIPSHSHSVTDPGHVHALSTFGGASGDKDISGGSVGTYNALDTPSAVTGISIGNTGGGGSHNTMQPSNAVNFIIKT